MGQCGKIQQSSGHENGGLQCEDCADRRKPVEPLKMNLRAIMSCTWSCD